MELRQLRAFVRVVELGSISRAALDLNVVQSALSQQITKLESELSTRLLQRSPQGVTPTEAGVAFFREAQLTLRHAVQAVRAALRPGDELQIDANGGWNLAGARQMIPWLAEQGVVLVEQPLAPLLDVEADTAGFAALQGLAPIPVVADESCWDLADLLRLAPYVQGINIKLVKCGGLSEGLLMARTARRLGLGVMLGCYSDGGLLNSGAAQLLPLVQWPDLDSHLNLIDDPFAGPDREGDVLRPAARLGLGAQLLQEVA